MKRSNRLLILLGIFLAIAGGIGAVVVANGSGGGGGSSGQAAASPTSTPEPTVQVVYAKVDINLGDQITSAMVGTKTVTISQRAALGQGTFSTVDQVVGKIAGGKIAANEVLIGSRDILSPGTMTDGVDIAGAIKTGDVAISMETDQISGVGTLIVPGDHVDIILSVYSDQIALTTTDQNKTAITLVGGKNPTTKMIIQDVKILATLLPPVAPAAATAPPAAGASAAPVPAAPTTPIVTLNGRHMVTIVEVTPQQAEIINWAQRAEKQDPQNYVDLFFVLRSPADYGQPDVKTSGITFKMLVDKYGVLPLDPRGILPADLAQGIQW